MPISDELAGLRRLLKALESKEMTISQKHADVTQREIEILKHEIKHLETVLARVKEAGR